MKEELIQIQWTCGSFEEAKKIAKDLLMKKWIACANIFPEIYSLYVWEEKICEEKEVKVFFKTKKTLFFEVRQYILQEASYSVPEISAWVFDQTNPSYEKWVYDQTV